MDLTGERGDLLAGGQPKELSPIGEESEHEAPSSSSSSEAPTTGARRPGDSPMPGEPPTKPGDNTEDNMGAPPSYEDRVRTRAPALDAPLRARAARRVHPAAEGVARGATKITATPALAAPVRRQAVV